MTNKALKTFIVLTLVVSILFVAASFAQSPACANAHGIDLPQNCESVAVVHPFEGVQNFREIEIPVDNDLQIKNGLLFRSDALHNLTDADVQALENMGIKTVVDLRAHEEIEEDPDRYISTVEYNINLPIGSDPAKLANIIEPEVVASIRTLWFEGKFEEIDQILADANLDIAKIRIDRYKDFANDFQPQIARYMRLLTNEDNFPMVFHCQGGKDRTGFIAAVTMLTLGFDKEAVISDYLTTNLYTYEELSDLYASAPHSLIPAFGAHDQQMIAALTAIEEEFGSFENYLEKGLNLTEDDVEAIRKNLLVNNSF